MEPIVVYERRFILWKVPIGKLELLDRLFIIRDLASYQYTLQFA